MQQKITVCAFVHYDGHMLAVRRSDTREFLPGKWELVGGHVEFGESLDTALAREICEETNLEAIIGTPFHAFTYLRNTDTHTVEIVYLATVRDPGALLVDAAEVGECRWITHDEALQLYDHDDAEFPAILRGFRLIAAGHEEVVP
jgi:8-oxo-dGTP diphosphatase